MLPPLPGLFTGVMRLLGLRHPTQRLVQIRSTEPDFLARFARTLCRWPRVYPLLVLAALAAHVSFCAADYAEDRSPSAAVGLILSGLPFVQYALALQYFATSHFDQFGCDVRATGEDFDESFDAIIRRPCQCTVDMIGLFTCVLSGLMFVATAFTHRETVWYRIVALAVMRVHGRTAMVLNTSCVAFVFWKHVKVIDVYANILRQRQWSVQHEHQVSILLRNIVRIRESTGVSTRLLGNIFSSATILGGAAAGLTVSLYRSAPFSVDVHAAVAGFILLQSVFFGVIWKLSDAKEGIVDVVNSGVFADTFLVRTPEADGGARARETGTTLDWYLVRRLLNEKWLSFYVCGMPLHSGAFIKQFTAVIASLLVIARSNDLLVTK